MSLFILYLVCLDKQRPPCLRTDPRTVVNSPVTVWFLSHQHTLREVTEHHLVNGTKFYLIINARLSARIHLQVSGRRFISDVTGAD